ncbi:MAG: hypothetical protein WC285_06115 [Candidatus Gracilibacteria bacterium]|jgi:hypothetical protein
MGRSIEKGAVASRKAGEAPKKQVKKDPLPTVGIRWIEEAKLLDIEEQYRETGISSDIIVQILTRHGFRFSKSALANFGQYGLLPVSKRVAGTGRGKHKGSEGRYPSSIIGRLQEIERMLMCDRRTLQEISEKYGVAWQIEYISEKLMDVLSDAPDTSGRTTFVEDLEKYLTSLNLRVVKLKERLDEEGPRAEYAELENGGDDDLWIPPLRSDEILEPRGDSFPEADKVQWIEDAELVNIEETYQDMGISSGEIMEILRTHRFRFSKNTLSKWVGHGLLPGSKRVAGTSGKKHSGSEGRYPVSIIRRIQEIRRMMLCKRKFIEEIVDEYSVTWQIEYIAADLRAVLAQAPDTAEKIQFEADLGEYLDSIKLEEKR